MATKSTVFIGVVVAGIDLNRFDWRFDNPGLCVISRDLCQRPGVRQVDEETAKAFASSHGFTAIEASGVVRKKMLCWEDSGHRNGILMLLTTFSCLCSATLVCVCVCVCVDCLIHPTP